MGSFCSAECAMQYREFKTHYKAPKLKGPPLIQRLLGLVGVGLVLLGGVHAAHRLLHLQFLAGFDLVGKLIGYK